MKNLKIGLILFLVVLVSGSTMAMGILKVDVVPGKKERALVDVLEAPNAELKAELKDSNGRIIYTDREESPAYNYKKAYDFSELNNGEYTFEVTLGKENELNNVVVNNGKVQITAQEEELLPAFKMDGKFLEFTFPNSTEKSAQLLLLNNDSKQWVFQEELNPEFDIQQTLNLSDLKPGSYKAVLISGKERYNYNFKLG